MQIYKKIISSPVRLIRRAKQGAARLQSGPNTGNTLKMIEELNKILNGRDYRRQLIRDLQEKVWNGPVNPNQNIQDILVELAYDLDFYEPSEELRKEDFSYYDDKYLEELLRIAINKLKM